MKFSLVSLSCAKLALNARPASFSHELVFDANSSTTGEDAHCQGSPAASDRVNRCKQPGHDVWDQLLCDDCNGGTWNVAWQRWDAHPWCEIGCCDGSVNKYDNRCECTSYGRKFVIDSGRGHVVGLNTAEKCCARDAGHRPKIHHADSQACGCGDVGTTLAFGGKDSDCCSGTAGSDHKCDQRICAKKGESGKCCRTINDFTAPADQPHTQSCGCFHAGDDLNPNDIVDWGNCCSGKINEAGNGCACIKDQNMVLSADIMDSDCCSGSKTDDGQHCKDPTCTSVGVKLATGGDHCCSGAQNSNNECVCVKSGEAPTGDGFSHLDCCSHKLDENGKCAFLFKGDAVPNKTDAASVCNSGRKDSSNRCRCVNKGAETDVESDCCSDSYANGKKCGCVPPQGALEYGAGEGACCTKTAVEGHCTCGVPGSPVLGMMNTERDCCAKDTAKDATFCGCVGADATHNVTYEESEYCCGGSAHYNGQACSCVKNNQAIGGWGHDKACCSGHVVPKNGARVCDTIAGVYEVSYRGEKREGWTLTLECDDSFVHNGDGGTTDQMHYEHLGPRCGAQNAPHSPHATFWIPYGTLGKHECLHKTETGLIGDHYDVPDGVLSYWGEVVYTLVTPKGCGDPKI